MSAARALRLTTEALEWWERHAEAEAPLPPLPGSNLYPMPGVRAFDDDDEFLAIPLFPNDAGEPIRVGDTLWTFPRAWRRKLETRPPSKRRLKFKLRLSDGTWLEDHPRGRKLTTIWKRAVYLEIFRSVKPVSIRTLRSRLETYGKIIAHAILHDKELEAFTLRDLAQISKSLIKKMRAGLKKIYQTLDWWSRQPGTSFKFFRPPTHSDAGLRPRFDARTVRGDAEVEDENTWQAFPDQFVAAIGEMALTLVEKVHPCVNACCRLLALRPLYSRSAADSVTEAISSVEWPEGFRPTSLKTLLSLCYDCQTAVQILISLLLGPRAEEVLSLPGICVGIGDLDAESGILKGWTFKFTRSLLGRERDWPLHPVLATAIAGQREFIEITEGKEFPWLWKNHSKLFATGGPATGTWKSLDTFVRRYGLRHLLEGSPAHHHRFRKTLARLVAVALQGGLTVLRRLYGHDNLLNTLRYVLSDDYVVAALKELSEKEEEALATHLIERRDEVLGTGGVHLREVVSNASEIIDLYLPIGRKDQKATTAKGLVRVLASSPDRLSVKQLVPGLIYCWRPSGTKGQCCSAQEVPNLAECDAECPWHAMMPEFEVQADANVRDALEHIASDRDNPLIREHYGSVVRDWCRRFPSVALRYANHPSYGYVYK